jgi:hypothetical protein
MKPDMKAWTNDELKKAMLKVAKRAATDPELRQLAAENPSAAIEKVIDRKVPKGLILRFVEVSAGFNLEVAALPGQLDDIIDKIGAAGCCKIPDALEVCCAKDIRVRPEERQDRPAGRRR